MQFFNKPTASEAASRSFVSLLDEASRDPIAGKERQRTRKQARILDDGEVQRLLEHVRGHSLSPFSDELVICLSFWAGLRAAELAALPISALQDAQGRIGKSVVVSPDIAKGASGRTIPMHPMIYNAANRFVEAHPTLPLVCFSARWGHIKFRTANSVAVYLSYLFKRAGFKGCSSHSGRRTFITNLAREANLYGFSLRDVQRLAGHAQLDTTQGYIDAAADLGPLVGALRSIPESPHGPFFEPRLRANGGRA